MSQESSESGYTLAQLLTWMSIALVIITLIIPLLEHEPRRADETESIASLKTLNQMEGQYSASYHGFTCTLAQLGGNPKLGAPSATSAQLVPDDLARGNKAGYSFHFSSCSPTGYEIIATPSGRAGKRTFCIDQNVSLRVNPNGGPTCTEVLQ